VPIGADNYGGISAKPGFLIYATGPAFYYGRQGDRPAQLKLFSLKDRKETTLIDDFGGGYASHATARRFSHAVRRVRALRCDPARRQEPQASVDCRPRR
jgi:hypothetical protein